jgi:serine/threonine protein kinase
MNPGERVGPYEILSRIGEGGMGAVYKARDTRLERTVAIKKSREAFSERFEREAQAIAALNHPHICQLRRRSGLSGHGAGGRQAARGAAARA